MSGAEAVATIQLTNACVGIANTIVDICRTVQDAQGLPPSIRELLEKLPVIEELLETAHENFAEGKVGASASISAQPVLKQCEQALGDLRDVLRQACPRNGDHRSKRMWSGAKTVFIGQESQVQKLLEVIQTNLKLLERQKIYAIGDKLDDLQMLTESLGADDSSKYAHSGQGNIVANEGGNLTSYVQGGNNNRQIISHGSYYEGPSMLDYPIPPLPLHCRPLSKEAQRRTDIKARLWPDVLDTRYPSISLALEGTCHWILSHPAYMSWKHPTRRKKSILWIKGHPGAGKSTLMKALNYHLVDSLGNKKDVVLSFYFNARGEDLVKTVGGLYRSLIVQALNTGHNVDEVLDDMKFGRMDIPNEAFFDNPPMPVLQQLLSTVLSKIGDRRIYLLIDALDEANEKDVSGAIDFLQRLGRKSEILLCFVCRHCPNFSISKELQVVVDDAVGHAEDINLYIAENLHIGKGSRTTQMRNEISRKANGIFMWVVLVIDMLNEEFRHGNIHGVQRRLEQMPEKLSDLLLEMSGRGTLRAEDFLLCLRWLLFSARPLTLPEFYFAMISGLHKHDSLEWDQHEVSYEDMNNFLITYSKGFAENTGTRVQFIHESVRDFLLFGNGLQVIYDRDAGNATAAAAAAAAAHKQLMRCCFRGVASDAAFWSENSPGLRRLQAAPDCLVRSEFAPFMGYAVEFVLHHAELCGDFNAQLQFCRAFKIEPWLERARFTITFRDLQEQNLLSITTRHGYKSLSDTLKRINVDLSHH